MYERQEVHIVLPSRSSPSHRSFSSSPPPPPPSQPPAPAREWATGQAGSSSAEPQPKKKELESEEDQKRKGHIPEPERGPQHHQEHQAEEAGGQGRVSESSAASRATPRQGGPSLPPEKAFQAPHCAQAGTP